MSPRNSRIEELAHELAQLDPADRAKVLAGAARLQRETAKAVKLSVPVLHGGRDWIAGDLRRETLYGDDGR